jgi:hypothetical protein
MSPDPLDAIFAQASEMDAKQKQLRVSMGYGMGQNPDEAEQARKVAKKLGTTQTYASENLKPLATAAAANQFDYGRFINEAPKTAGWLSEPSNAAIAHDSVQDLQSIEASISKAAPYAKLTPSQRQAVASDILRVSTQNRETGWRGEVAPTLNSMEGSMRTFGGNVGATVAAVPEAIFKSAGDVLWNYQNEGLTDLAKKIAGNFTTGLGTGPVAQSFVNKNPQPFTAKTGPSRFLVDPKTGQQFENPNWATFSGEWVKGADWARKGINELTTRDTANTLASAPGMGAEMAAFGPLTPFVFASNAATEKVNAARAYMQSQHPDVPLSAEEESKAATEGFLTGVVNALLMTKVPGSVPTSTVKGALGQYAARAGTLGTSMNLADTTLARLHGEDKAPLEGNLQSVLTFLALDAPGVIGHTMAIRQNQSIIESLAKASKLRDRSPEKFQEVIESVTKDTAHENVLIDAKTFFQTAQEKGLDPVALAQGLGVKNLQEAVDAGTDLVIPTAAYATQVAGNPAIHEAFAPDLKFGAGEWSARELGAWTEEARTKAEADLKAEASGEAQASVMPDGLQVLQERLRTQLIQDGRFDPSTADATAAVNARMVYNMIKGEGLDPVTEFDKYGLTVTRPLRGENPVNMVDLVLNRLVGKDVEAQGPLYQGPVDQAIPKGIHYDDLAPEHQQRVVAGIERDIQNWADHPEEFHKAYEADSETFGGRLVNGDIMRRLLPTVKENVPLGLEAGKATDTAIESHMMTLRSRLVDRAIDLAGDKPVGVTAGGQSSGKTTIATRLLNKELLGAVIDAPHDDFNSVTKIVDKALGRGKDVSIMYVDRPDFGEAYKSMIRRAIREGRPVDAPDMAGKHVKVPSEMLKVGERYRNNPRVDLRHMTNAESQWSEIGGSLADDGKDAMTSIRNRNAAAQSDLENQARAAYIDYQKGVQDGTELPIPADTRRRIEASIPGGISEISGISGGYHGSDQRAELKASALPDQAQGLDRLTPELLARVQDQLLSKGIGLTRVDPNSPEVRSAIEEVVGEDPLFQSDRKGRARSAMSRALSPSGQSAELTRRADEAMAEEAKFQEWGAEVKTVQAGDIFPEDKRGFIQFGPDKRVQIGLLEKMDPTTFFHEFGGHFGLELMRDLASRPEASDRMKGMWGDTLKFLGVESGDQIGRDHHEKYARAFERYLMEGKPPSEELRPVFARVKEWFKLFYRQVKNLGVNLNPEIRGVFDRMLASDVEIERARATSGSDREHFATAEDMGVSQAEFDLYRKSKAREVQTAQDALTARIFKEMQEQRSDAMKAERDSVVEEFGPMVEAQPVYQAFKMLSEGKLDDGTSFKLDKQSLMESFGKDIGKELPRKFQRLYTLNGGLDVETAAEMLGFESGRDMVDQLRNMEPLKEKVSRLADEEMVRRHGDILVDGTMVDAAVEAVHNEARAEALAMELKAYAKKAAEVKPFVDLATKDKAKAQDFWRRGLVREVPPMDTFRKAATETVSQQPIRELDPNRYLVASRKASRESFEAAAKDDFATARDTKQKELLNHFLYLEAVKAQEEAGNIFKYVKKGGGSARFQGMLGLAGKVYQDQWNNLAERYEFISRSNKSMGAATSALAFEKASNPANTQSLAEFIQAQREAGEEVMIDPTLVGSRTANYREANIQELRAVKDALKNIETIARQQVEFDLNGKKIAFKEAVAEIDTVARQNNKSEMVPRTGAPLTRTEKAARWIQGADAYMSKMEWSIDRLDGGDINGPARRYIKKPIDDASGAEKALGKQVFDQIHEAVKARTPEERAKELDPTNITFPKSDRPLTKGQVMSWVMNLGTEENRRVALLGEGLVSEDGSLSSQVDQALKTLTASDCQFIQSIWDSLEAMKPLVVEKERRITGVEPKWKTVTPFTVETADGQTVQMKGGYYPLKADREVSDVGRKQMEPNLAEGSFSRPTTSRSHTKEVTGATYPLLLDYQTVLGEHLPSVIRDVTMGEAIANVSKIIMHPDVSKAIGETLGPKHEAEFLPWLQAVAGNIKEDSKNPILKMLMSRRSGMVTARLAGNLGSYLVQVGDSFKPWTEVPVKDLLAAHWDIRTNPKEMIRQIRELSPNEMAFREENFNRDIKEMLDARTGLDQKMGAVSKFLFEGFAVMDNLQSFPAWLAKYRGELKSGADSEQAVMAADRLISRTMQAGEARNMSRMMREPGLMKMLTTFGGDANTWYGILSSSVHSKNIQRISVAVMALVFEQLVSSTMRGRLPKKDEDLVGWSTQQAASAMFNPFGFYGDLADLGVKKASGHYAHLTTPTMQAFEKILSVPGAVRSEEQGTKDKEEVAMELFDAAGTWGGVPGTGQIIKTWKYSHAVRAGEAPSEPIDVAKGVAFGPPAKGKK